MSSGNRRERGDIPAGSRKGSSKRHGRHQEQEQIEGPTRPDNWHDLVSTDYEYPAELDDLSRRDRRRAKKEWRRDDHDQRMAWLREQRQSEPVSPASILVVVILLGIVILGIGGGLPRILGKDESKEPVGLLTPAKPLPLPSASGGPEPTRSQPTAGESTPPLQTERPSSTATLDSNEVVATWARGFYSRTPATESYDQLITRVSQYLTADMASSFTAQGDSTYDALKTDGGASRVVSAAVSAPKPGTAPTDTPSRISRFVNVVIDITGTKPQRITVPLLVTVVQQESSWVISDVDGGTGP